MSPVTNDEREAPSDVARESTRRQVVPHLQEREDARDVAGRHVAGEDVVADTRLAEQVLTDLAAQLAGYAS